MLVLITPNTQIDNAMAIVPSVTTAGLDWGQPLGKMHSNNNTTVSKNLNKSFRKVFANIWNVRDWQ